MLIGAPALDASAHSRSRRALAGMRCEASDFRRDLPGAWIARATGIDPVDRFVTQAVVLAVVPLAFALGVLVGGFARTGDVVELGAWLGSNRRRSDLDTVLADTLGDPLVELAFWRSAHDSYVDGSGRPIVLPDAPDDVRDHESIDLDGRHVGAIIYDPNVVADAEMVRAAGRVVAFAIDRERLVADLTASRDELRSSRARSSCSASTCSSSSAATRPPSATC